MKFKTSLSASHTSTEQNAELDS